MKVDDIIHNYREVIDRKIAESSDEVYGAYEMWTWVKQQGFHVAFDSVRSHLRRCHTHVKVHNRQYFGNKEVISKIKQHQEQYDQR